MRSKPPRSRTRSGSTGTRSRCRDRIGLMTPMRYAAVAKKGVKVDARLEGLVAMYELLEDRLTPDDWTRFETPAAASPWGGRAPVRGEAARADRGVAPYWPPSARPVGRETTTTSSRDDSSSPEPGPRTGWSRSEPSDMARPVRAERRVVHARRVPDAEQREKFDDALWEDPGDRAFLRTDGRVTHVCRRFAEAFVAPSRRVEPRPGHRTGTQASIDKAPPTWRSTGARRGTHREGMGDGIEEGLTASTAPPRRSVGPRGHG